MLQLPISRDIGKATQIGRVKCIIHPSCTLFKPSLHQPITVSNIKTSVLSGDPYPPCKGGEPGHYCGEARKHLPAAASIPRRVTSRSRAAYSSRERKPTDDSAAKRNSPFLGVQLSHFLGDPVMFCV